MRQLGDSHFPGLDNIRLHAFVVDHKARPESTREAKQVVELLDKNFGLIRESRFQTRILSLQWPPGVFPSELPDFETEARRLRYQALGKACYQASIPSLLLGHHQADEHETIMMRLVEGYQGEGLRGVSKAVGIPHCIGVYGASRSGGRDYTMISEEKQTAKARDVGDRQKLLPPMEEYRQKGFEYGGVRIYRPLMEYGKQELEATLYEAGVPWVTDPTNEDPTLTIRNTIRHLMQRRLLPKAIDNGSYNQPSALRVAADTIRRKHERRDERAEFLFQACDVISFNARSGYLEVRIPLSTALNSLDLRLLPEDQQRTEVEYVRARLVCLLLSVVSPKEVISLQTLEAATNAMFGDVQKDCNADLLRELIAGGEWAKPLKFTAGGVLGERVAMPSKELSLPGAQPSMLDPKSIWRLSRAPFPKHLPKSSCVVPPAAPVTQVRTEKSTSSVGHSGPGSFPKETATEEQLNENLFREPEWQLWDRRYWIQVYNPTNKPLKICPFDQDRRNGLGRLLNETENVEGSKRLRCALRSCGPPHVRHTIPAIVDEGNNVLALPTIDFAPATGKSEPKLPRWRVRYKSVVLPARVQDERVIAPTDGTLKGVDSAL
ncbi:MAG: hypothetical protein Q9184_001954 [Pyrenodesmia sp. 2 TL-2023]